MARKQTAEAEGNGGTGLAKVAPGATLALDESRWALVARTFARDATPDEFAMFRNIAEREGLDPFTKQIHFIKRKDGTVAFVVGVHGLVARLNRVQGYRGIQSAVVCQGETCKIDAAAGTVAHVYDPAQKRGPVVGAWARGQIGNRLPVLRYVSIDEYRGQTPIWREKPASMIEKVAIVQCARALAPEELRGLYAAEEFGGETGRDGAVLLPEQPKPKMADVDQDALAVSPFVVRLAKLGTPESTETLNDLLEEARTAARLGWSPTAMRLFKSHVERRRAELETAAKELPAEEPPAEETDG